MMKIIPNGKHNFLANIFFTDATAGKIRPVLLLDILYMPLTSNTSTKAFQLIINI